MTTILLVRHGETEWNRARRLQGATDVPLNDTGRVQALDVARALASQLPDGAVPVYSSDLVRAAETASIIASEHASPAPVILPGLRERSFGEAEGADLDECTRRWGDWRDADIPGAEPWEHVRVRALRAVRRIAQEVRRRTSPDPGTAIAVSHGALIRELILHATAGERPAPGERLGNGSVHRFVVGRESLRLDVLSDAAL